MSTNSDHPAQDTSNDLRGLSVGEILRRTRMHYGRSLEEVESVIRIRTSLLEAIEADDSAKLPGRVYAIGFIRSYAEYLGLDGAQIVELYKQQLGQSALRPQYNFPVGADESKRPDLTIFLVSIVGLLIVGGCYHFFKPSDDVSETSYQSAISPENTESENAANPIIPSVETAFAPIQNNKDALSTPDVKAKDPVWPPKVEDVMPEMISSIKVATIENLEVDADATDITSQNVANTQHSLGASDNTAVNADEALVDGEDDAEVTDVTDDMAIRIVAKDPTWMQIKDTEGSVVFTGILKKGHDIKVPAGAMGWRMDTGNAGGLDIYIGEDIIPPLGGNGIVVRRIPLFADALRDYGR
jgi:cytoskeleton protein RodZ